MSEPSETGTDRIREAEEAGFPSETLDGLLTRSEERYLANVEKHGAGKNWLSPSSPEARWHIWKACDELFQARDSVHRGSPDRARLQMADALNHMLFAMEIAEEEDDGLRADGSGELGTESCGHCHRPLDECWGDSGNVEDCPNVRMVAGNPVPIDLEVGYGKSLAEADLGYQGTLAGTGGESDAE